MALIAAISILWGLNWPAMKLALSELQPWTFRVLSVYAAGMTLLIVARTSGEPIWPNSRELPAMLLVAAFGVTGWHILTAHGLLLVGGGKAAILAFTMPLWAMLLSVPVLGERIDRKRLFALALGMAGIGVLLFDSLAQLGGAPLGTALILGAAFCWACATVGTKAFEWSIGTIALSGWLMTLGGVPIFLMWLVLEAPGDYSQVTIVGLLSWLYVSFVALVFCFTSYLRIVRLVPASVAAISTLAIPIVGVISSALVLGEEVGTIELTSLVFVLLAITLVLWPSETAS